MENIIIKPGMLKGIISETEDIYVSSMFFVAGAIGNDVLCRSANIAQTKEIAQIIDIIKMAGGVIKNVNGSISAHMSAVMKGIDINLKDAENMLYTVAVLCAFLKGESRIYGVNGVKNKDLLKRISSEFNHLGVYTEVTADGLYIKGCQVIKSDGAYIWGDSKLAFALMVMACRAEGEVCIFGTEDAKGIDKYIGYYKQLEKR